MKFENTSVFNFEGAIRGMRNPLASWEKSDSCDGNYYYSIGKNDMELMQRLIKAGSEHRKFMRQIIVSVDITAPMYWWSEADTYKVGTTANSTSKMHKLASTPITMDCFEMGDFEEHLEVDDNDTTIICHWRPLIFTLERLRQRYNETKDKKVWKELLRLLPNSWLQTRTITMNYENILNMYHQRKNHKLNEWKVDFCNWVESLPYAKELIIGQD